MTRYVCIHGHFYQPPRESPWLEVVEREESAYPYHDWNERVNAECYAPNAASRILDGTGRITQITNNYGRISFNFGPTLLAWMETHSPETYAAVMAADRESEERFEGHGSALAQAYNHMILPLANERDIHTQVRWGLVDFEHRFGRRAEGMWLPETAVDLRTLDALAMNGVRFTILAPGQADAVRPLQGGDWRDVRPDRVDPSRPYRVRLPGGRAIDVFFYDGPGSRAVAFENLLENGERFVERLLRLTAPDGDRLAHIATDGETYGHHRRFGDMALAFALHAIENGGHARLTNYAQYLAMHPPTEEVRVRENTSWSCIHGVERWRSDCGCETGGRPGWTQAWRAPLRAAFDWLRDTIAPRFEQEAGRLLHDPWAARDDYIRVILDRTDANVEAFLAQHTRQPADAATTTRILELLEMQRHAMLMYTSCGWFFNDVSGIETVQVLRYASRVVQLARRLFGEPLDLKLRERLEHAKSNVAEATDARSIYEKHVKPHILDLRHVGAHFAVSSTFAGHRDAGDVYTYRVQVDDQSTSADRDATLSIGLVRASSRVTHESERLTYAVLHFGNHNLSGGIRRFTSGSGHAELRSALLDAFEEPDLARVISLLAEFPEFTVSLRSLFADRQREILYRLIDANLRDAEGTYRRVYDANLPLMRYLSDLGMPLPRAFTMAAEYVLNRDLDRTFATDPVDLRFARSLLDQARATRVQLDAEGLAFRIQQALERLANRCAPEAPATQSLEDLLDLTALARADAFDVDLWRVQNAFWRVRCLVYPEMVRRAGTGDPLAMRWAALFATVGQQLAVAVD